MSNSNSEVTVNLARCRWELQEPVKPSQNQQNAFDSAFDVPKVHGSAVIRERSNLASNVRNPEAPRHGGFSSSDLP